MAKNKVCKECGRGCEDNCTALDLLYKFYRKTKTESKMEIVEQLRKELGMTDFEVADDIRELAEKVIEKMPELHHIIEYEIKVGYVRAWENKRANGKTVFADCTKVTGRYLAYLPYDFVITVYEPNACILSDNQKKILLLHELKHITLGEKGLTIRPHDIEDFESILKRYGVNWNYFNQEVPDILAGD